MYHWYELWKDSTYLYIIVFLRKTFQFYSLRKFQVCSTVLLTIVIMLYNPLTVQPYLSDNSKFILPPTSPIFSTQLPFPHTTLATTFLLSVSVSLTSLVFSHSISEWYHAVFTCLAYFSYTQFCAMHLLRTRVRCILSAI